MKKRIRKELFNIALPVTIQMLVQYALMFMDSVFVGQYNVKGLSALNNALIPFFTLNIFLIFLPKGAGILISQSIGAGKLKRAKRFAESAFTMSQILSFVYFFIWLVLSREILTLIGAKGEILDMGVSYMRVMAFSYLFMGLHHTAGTIFESVGNTRPTMIVAIVVSIMNIFLDWVLVFGKLGFPQMGIPGAALGTVVSQLVGTLILLIFLARHNGLGIHIGGMLRPNLHRVSQSLKMGIPLGANTMIWSLGNTIMVAMLNSQNAMFAGFFGVFNLLLGLSVRLYLGVGVATMTMIGKATGAKNHHESLHIGNMSVAFALVVCMINAAMFVLFPKVFVSVFTNDAKVIETIAGVLYMAALIIFPKAMNIIVGNAIQGTGNTKWALYTQIAGTTLLVISAYVLMIVLKLGFIGILWAIFFDELWRGVATTIKFFVDNRKLRDITPLPL